MSGGGKTQADTTAPQATSAAQPSLLSFSAPDHGATVANQLQNAGLLSAVTNPGLLYSPVSVPVIGNPAQLQKWMLSQGMGYVDDTGKMVNAPAAAPVASAPASSGSSSTAKPASTTNNQDNRGINKK